MSERPRLILVVSEKRDAESAVEFVRRHRADAGYLHLFAPEKLEDALRKCRRPSEREKTIRAYVRRVYCEKGERIRRGLTDTGKEWGKKEKRYCDLVAEIFDGHPWPRGTYRGYASIFYMFPRDIKQKMFFFPYYRRGGLDPAGTVAHELLHFMFFGYVAARYGAREGIQYRGKDKDYVWRVSEAFNSVIEDWAPYRKIIPARKWVYPETRELYADMRKRWRKDPSVPNLLGRYF